MSENLISREKAYEVLSDYYHHTTELQHKALREALDMVPSVDIDLSDYSDRLWRNAYERGKADAESRKKGKWVKTGQSFVNPNTFLGYSCSCCNFHVRKEDPLFLFCPSCGAEMKKGEDE